MDVLGLYSDIAKVADEATRKTSELISQTKILANIKPAASIAFHGALGPGLFLYDPMAKFVKGEAAFAKAAKDFVVDAKQMELGGKIAAKGIEQLGSRWTATSDIMVKGSQKFATVVKEWTSTSKMMESTITSLAGKTGLLATSFTGMAQAIKISTGPVATALLGLDVVYSQFIKKWVDESDKLETKLRTLSSTFKAAGGTFSAAGLGRMAEGYIAGGGTRGEFAGMMQRSGGYGNISATNAAQTIEIARVIARQTGEDQAKVLGRYLEGVAVLSATKSATEVAKTLREYRLMAGPLEQQGFRGPLDRYASWRQDVGQGLSRWSDQYLPVVQRMMFQAGYSPDTTPTQLLGRGIRSGARYLGEGALNLAGRMPAIPLTFGMGLGPSIGGMAEYFRDRITKAPDIVAEQNREAAINKMYEGRRILEQGYTERQNTPRITVNQNPFGVTGLPKYGGMITERIPLTPMGRQMAERQIYEGAQLGFLGVAGQLQGEVRGAQPGIQSLESKLMRRRSDLEAFDAMTEGGKGFSKYAETAQKVLVSAQKMKDFPEDTAKHMKDMTDALGTLPDAMQKAVLKIKLEDANGLQALQNLLKMPRDVLEASIKRTEEDLRKVLVAQEGKDELALKMKSAAGFPSTTPTLPKPGSMNIGQLEKAIRSQESSLVSLEQEYRRLESTPAAQRDLVRWAQIQEELKQKRTEIMGMDENAIKQYNALMRAGKTTEALALAEEQQYNAPLGPWRAMAATKISDFQREALPRQQEIERQQFGSGIQRYQHAGLITAAEMKKIQEEVTAGGSTGVAAGSISLAEIAGKRQRAIEAATMRASLGLGIGIGGIEAGIARRRGMAGPETGLMTDERGLVREQATTVWNIKKEMMDKELQFTVQYAQARANIIKVHYDNINQMERGRLQQMDLKYGPQIRYGQEVYGAQQGMVGAAMGRYTGEDYWRGQYRGERGLAEGRMNLMFGLANQSVPEYVQKVQAIRSQREAEEDFRREQARQREHDTRSYRAGANTWDAVRGTGINMRDFEASEGGRALQLQILQQNQAAYSRMGIDVSGQIIGLQGKQQAFAGRKLATEMGIRGREGVSIERQIADMRKTIGDAPLDTESRQKAGVELAEKYAEASKHFLSVGDLGKAAQYSKAQEDILRQVPEILKRDFGDAQKKSLRQLEIHTGLLTDISRALGGTPDSPLGKKTLAPSNILGGAPVGTVGSIKKDIRPIPGGGMAAFGGVGFNVVPTTTYVPGLHADENDARYEELVRQGQAEGEEIGSKYNYREGLLDPKEESSKYLIKKYGVNKYMDYLDSQVPKEKYNRLAEMGGREIGPNAETLARDDVIWGRGMDSGITSSPDSQRDNQKPEDKMGTAADQILKAGELFSKGATIHVKSDGTGQGTMGQGSGQY